MNCRSRQLRRAALTVTPSPRDGKHSARQQTREAEAAAEAKFVWSDVVLYSPSDRPIWDDKRLGRRSMRREGYGRNSGSLYVSSFSRAGGRAGWLARGRARGGQSGRGKAKDSAGGGELREKKERDERRQEGDFETRHEERRLHIDRTRGRKKWRKDFEGMGRE
ncbi:hypothetical protein Mp_2g06400 [Marchantia polymorpha subsp. ruderalis]|nr:hypothetical protein MARPO_0021s0095 [Marchantia polymorpha]BBN01314.1 hypothetical protein Mp_2g06400 [Marchantia polymorpha subsp. ruderalis]|eukprot:PTQ44239.1 hypothetical protein MARPO_0021s0095 [Marchantia polymorpha]